MKRFCAIIFILYLSSFASAGNIYKSYDSEGNPIYSDKRPKGDYEVVFSTKDDQKTQEETEVPTITPVRTMDSVRTVINTLNDDLNQVYQTLLEEDDTLQGTVTLGFTINREGTVINCGEDETNFSKAVFNGLLCEKVQGLNYGLVESLQPMNVNFTFTFSPGN